ncbi:extracellular solute-binding protein [Actinomadura sp. 6N118]|uniref:extracellular solute-binding protein n=1 Tax=Actinomadura sp. 6N118 TaxID=3375151 RepID=UPI0037BA7C44
MGTFASSPPARLTAVAFALSLALAACGGSGGQESGGKETIVFAEAGLGTEGKATQDAIKAFEQANPNITVKVQTLSADSTQYLQQLQQRLVAGSSTPDVIRVDETYPASLAKSGWLYDLNKFNPDLSGFLPAALAPGKYNGHTYAVPWFVGAEGLLYRTDLVKEPPATPAELVSAAQAAMKKDPKIKYGLAFEGAKYEGAVTSFMVFAGAFGGKFDPANLNTPQNQQALQFAYDAVNTNHIAPKAVTGWKEGEVQQAFTSGQAAFSINWPFVFAASKGSPTEGKIGFVPLAGKGATLGIQNLAINAKTKHAEAAWKFIQYLNSVPAQVKRAVDAGDPPSLTAAYNADLFKQAPYYKQVQKVAEVGAARPPGPST